MVTRSDRIAGWHLSFEPVSDSVFGSGSHKVPYVLVNISVQQAVAISPTFSTTIGFQTKNSSDLDVGRRPELKLELKSDEFLLGTQWLSR